MGWTFKLPRLDSDTPSAGRGLDSQNTVGNSALAARMPVPDPAFDQLTSTLDGAVASMGEAAHAWGRAAAAVPPPGAPDSFEEAYDEALSGLSDASTAQQTATSLRRGLLPQSMKPAVQAEHVAQLRLNMEITRLRMAWDIMCNTGPLGFAYNLPATGFDTAGLASGVFSLHRRIGPLLQASLAVGAGAPRVPSARPEEATFTFGVGMRYPREEAMRPITEPLSGHFGHAWSYLVDVADQAGVADWASQELHAHQGAAAYEAALQDRGEWGVVDLQKLEDVAHVIRRATDKHGTSEDVVWDALANLNRAELQALDAIYLARYGMVVATAIHDDFSGEELDECLGYMTGDPVEGCIRSMENHIDDDYCNPKAILDELRRVPPAAWSRFAAARESDPRLKRLEQRALSARYVTSDDRPRGTNHYRECLQAAFEGRFAEAEARWLECDLAANPTDWFDAARVQQEMSWGKAPELAETAEPVNAKTVLNQLEESGDPVAMAKAFDARHGYTLVAALELSDPSPQRNMALALATGGVQDPRYIAGKLRVGKPDEIRSLLADPELSSDDPEIRIAAQQRRASVLTAFDTDYHKSGETPASALSNHLDRKFSREGERDWAKSLMRHGVVDPAFAAHAAITAKSSALLTEAVAGLSSSQMDATWKRYQELYGRDLDTEVVRMHLPRHFAPAVGLMEGVKERDKGALPTGDDVPDELFDDLIAVRGRPETAQEYLERESARHARFGKDHWYSPLTDGVEAVVLGSHTSDDNDRAWDGLRSLFNENGAPMGDTSLQEVGTWANRHGDAIADHRVASRIVADCIATGVDILVAVLVDACLAGTASPWVVKLLATLAATGAHTATVDAMTNSKEASASVRSQSLVDVLSAFVVAAIHARSLRTAADGADALRLASRMAEETQAIGRRALYDEVIKSVGLQLLEGATPEILTALLGSDDRWKDGVAAGLVTTLEKALMGAAVNVGTNAVATHGPEFLGSDEGQAILGAGASLWTEGPSEEEAGAWVVDQFGGYVKSKGDSHVDAVHDRQTATAAPHPNDLSAGAPHLPVGSTAPAPSLGNHTAIAHLDGHEWMVTHSDDGYTLARTDPDGRLIVRIATDAEIHATQANDHLFHPLPSSTVATPADGTDRAGAHDMYNGSVGDDPSREVAVYSNPETGEYVVVQGEATTVDVGDGQVPLPRGNAQRWKEILDADGGFWVLDRHYHPSTHGGPNQLQRLPSGASYDMSAVFVAAHMTGQPAESHIDYLASWGPDYSRFGYDPNTGVYFLDYPVAAGPENRLVVPFPNIEAYQAFLGAHGVDPGPIPDFMRSGSSSDPTTSAGAPSSPAGAIAWENAPRPAGLDDEVEKMVISYLRGQRRLNEMINARAETAVGGTVAAEAVWRIKGEIAEALSEPIQQSVADEYRAAGEPAEIERAVRIWLPGHDGRLEASRLFTDDLVASRSGEELSVHAAFEVKSGQRGHTTASAQTVKWLAERILPGAVIELEDGSYYQHQPSDAATSQGIPQGHPLHEALEEGRIGRVVGLMEADRHAIAPDDSPFPSPTVNIDGTAHPELRGVEHHDLGYTSEEIEWLALRLIGQAASAAR